MTRYSVAPLPDGVNQRYGWQVKAGGRRKSKHTKKSAAMAKAKRFAGAGDTIVVHRMDGTIQRQVSY